MKKVLDIIRAANCKIDYYFVFFFLLFQYTKILFLISRTRPNFGSENTISTNEGVKRKTCNSKENKKKLFTPFGCCFDLLFFHLVEVFLVCKICMREKGNKRSSDICYYSGCVFECNRFFWIGSVFFLRQTKKIRLNY